MKPGITGLVLTYNGERLLRQCLQSLAFCDQILVVDSYSKDSTETLVHEAGGEPRVRFLERVWEGPGPQFAHALDQIETEWVFSLDQDEMCTPALRHSIEKVMTSGQAADGYWIARRSWYYDRFMRHSGWYPDRLLRLFRNGRMDVHVSGAHYSFHPKGATSGLDGDILHYPYASFSQHLEKINDYAQKGADDMAARGKAGGLARGVGHGIGRFVKIYLLKRGFLDGRAGFINAVHGAFYAFLKYVRVGEGDWGAPFDHLDHEYCCHDKEDTWRT